MENSASTNFEKHTSERNIGNAAANLNFADIMQQHGERNTANGSRPEGEAVQKSNEMKIGDAAKKAEPNQLQAGDSNGRGGSKESGSNVLDFSADIYGNQSSDSKLEQARKNPENGSNQRLEKQEPQGPNGGRESAGDTADRRPDAGGGTVGNDGGSRGDNKDSNESVHSHKQTNGAGAESSSRVQSEGGVSITVGSAEGSSRR